MTRPKVDPLVKGARKVADRWKDGAHKRPGGIPDFISLSKGILRFARRHGAAERRRALREAAGEVERMREALITNNDRHDAANVFAIRAANNILELLKKGGRT